MSWSARCSLSASKPAVYNNCLLEEKRLAKNPPPPPKPRSALQRKRAACASLGKGPAIMECQRQAAKPSQFKAAKKSPSPLERELNSCRSLGKSAAIFACSKEARKRYAPAQPAPK